MGLVCFLLLFISSQKSSYCQQSCPFSSYTDFKIAFDLGPPLFSTNKAKLIFGIKFYEFIYLFFYKEESPKNSGTRTSMCQILI